MNARLNSIYRKLYAYFGPQHWWPARTQFEVMVGAILTQNTSWLNVEKAIGNLKDNKLLSVHKLAGVSDKKLAGLIRPAGYYNLKARRLKNFVRFFLDRYNGSAKDICAVRTQALRRELLSVNGVGPETADSILLYALGKPIFVIDAYTKRILIRHGMAGQDDGYQELQGLFMRSLKKDAKLFNEYHALLVRLGKEFCAKGKGRCQGCPLN